MNNEHLSKEALLEALYGAAPQPDHLRACSACRERHRLLLEARKNFVAAEPEVPEDLLTAQRRVVWSRLPRTTLRVWGRLVPVAATLAIAAAFLIDFGRHPVPSGPAPADNSEVFQEVFELVADPAPQPVEPIRSFFEESQ